MSNSLDTLEILHLKTDIRFNLEKLYGVEMENSTYTYVDAAGVTQFGQVCVTNLTDRFVVEKLKVPITENGKIYEHRITHHQHL